MKNSLIKIVINIILVIAFLILITSLFNKRPMDKIIIENKFMTVSVYDNKVEVVENIDLKVKKGLENFRVSNLIEDSKKIEEIFINNEKQNNMYCTINNKTKEDIKQNIKITYLLDISNIKQYTDVSLLMLHIYPNQIKTNNVDITINLDNSTQNFNVENLFYDKNYGNIKTTKISDTKFNLKIKDAYKLYKNNIYITIDNEALNFGSNQNKSFDTVRKTYEKTYKKQDYAIYVLVFSIFVTIVSYIIYVFTLQKKQRTNNIRREWDGLISPVLAETIIDGKIDAKDLIMTVVTDLITRGNLEVINDNSIRLLHKNNIEKYEEEVLNLLFQGKDVLYFSDFKNIFIKLNSKTIEIFKYIQKIKKDIIDELMNKDILNKKLARFVNIFKIFVITNIVVIIFTMINMFNLTFAFMIILITILIALTCSSKNITNYIFEKLFSLKNRKAKIYLIIIAIILLALIVYNINSFSNVIFSLLVILDLIFLTIQKEYSFTKKGAQERIKVLELKNYLEEYSIMQDRDMKEIIIWDKYLVYATAFGITNNVTKKAYSEYMNANMALQFVANMINIF